MRLLRRIARAQLVERETDKVERIFDLMRQAAGQLPERGESFEAIQLMLALTRMPELPDHVVEASRQQADLVASMRLRNRLQPARGNILRRIGDRMNRLHVTIGENIGEDQPDRENRHRDRQLPAPILRQRRREIGEIRDHLHVAQQMVLDLDRNQIHSRLRREWSKLAGRDFDDRIRMPQLLGAQPLCLLGPQRRANQMRIRAVDNQVLTRRDRNFEPLGMQTADVTMQPIAIRITDRGQLLHADLNHPRKIFNLLLRSSDDSFLRPKTNPNLRAKGQAKQPDHEHNKLGLEVERRKI